MGGRADRVAATIADLGQPPASIVGDMLDAAQAREIVQRADHALGGLDLLATTIGQASFNSILGMAPEQWDYN